MKQILLKTWLMLVCLLMGAGTMWADGSIEINTTNSGVTGSYADKTFDVNDVTFGFTQWMKNTNIQAKKSTTNSCYNVDAIPGNIKKITVVQTGTARAIKMYGGTSSKPTTEITAPSTNATMEFDFTGKNYTYFSMTTPSNAVYINTITITYETSSGGGSTPTYNVTIANDIANGSVTASHTSATANTEVTLTATPSTGYEFGSWNVTDASSNAITVTDNKFTMPASNVNVSATFNEIQSGDNTTVTWIASEQGYTNGTQYTSATVDDNISLAFGDGTNDGKYYDTGTGVRLYANGKVTVSAKQGCTISRIVLTYSEASYTGTFSASPGRYSLSSTTGTWTGSASSVVLTNTASSGHARIQKIAVTYTAEGGDTPEPEKTTPTLSFASATATAYLDALSMFVAPELSTDPKNLIGVTYSMTGDPVGTINSSTGALTLTAAGTATITASYAGDGVNYNAAEDASYTLTVNANAPEKTIAEFIASEGGICYLTGIVSNIAANNYGNFDLTDDSGTIYVYGCLTSEGERQKFNTLDVVEGDKIKVLANEYTVFNEKKEAVNVTFVEEIEIEKPKYTVIIETPENGTLVVKEGEKVINSGDKIEQGNTITIECTPANEDYRLKNWQAVDGSTHTFTTTFTYDVTADVTIKANFELIPVRTVAFSVNGTIIQTDDLKEGAAVAVPSDPEAINGKVFTGWIETATVVGATPAYVIPAATATEDVTYYAVFATYNSEAAPDQWQITTLSELTSSDVFVMASGTNAISSANGTSGNPAAVALTVSAGKITSGVTDAIKWTLTGNATDGYTFYKKGSSDYLYVNTTATSGSNTCIRVGTQNSNIRNNWKPDTNGYLKTNDSYTDRYLSFYSTGSDFRGYVNTSNGAFAPTFYKYIPGGDAYTDYTTTPAPTSDGGTINFVATTGDGKYYATFSNTRAIKFDEVFVNEDESCFASVKAYAVAIVDGQIYRTDQYKVNNDGNYTYIPANTGVLFEYILEDGYTFDGAVPFEYADAEAEYLNAVEDNMLKACPTTGIFKEEADGNYYYKLAYGDNTKKEKLGFWWGAEDGSGNFKVKAGGAVLVVPQSQGSNLRGFSFNEEGDITGIDAMEIANGSTIFNLQGQRVSRLQQGVNIVNGKKVIR